MKELLLMSCLLLVVYEGWAQTGITGKVTDNAEPLPGVSIVIKGTAVGTTSDADGTYSINAPADAVLVFSFVGYTTTEVPVDNRTVIDVVLTEDVKTLSEVVVIGYGTQTKRDLSTSVSSVSSQTLERQPVASFEQSLAGQAPGIQITTPTGNPGSAMNVRVRGNNSVSLSNQPLYVVDGVPIFPSYDQELSIGNQRPNPLAAINPNDIESIDVLKDGAAAAIYGSRAANGVVVITTKRGKEGRAELTFNAYYGVQELRKKIDVLNGPEFASMFNDARAAAGLSPAYDLDTVRTLTDWQDLIYRSAPIQSYQVTASGGSEKTKYYISASYFDQEGIVINSGFKRINFKMNLDQELSSKFRVGTSLNLSRGDRYGSTRSELRLENSGTIIGALAQIPTMPVYNSDGSYALNPFTLSDNPVGGQMETHNRALINQLIGNVYGELDVLDNLVFRSSFGIDFKAQSESEFLTRQLPGFLNAPSPSRGSARTGANFETIWLWENTLTYTLNRNDHNFTFLLGASVQESNRFISNASITGFPSNAVPYLSAGTENRNVSSFEDDWGLVSYYGRVLYNFKDRYLASASLRADGSSRFSDGNKFGYFPAVSFGWRIMEEDFFPDVQFLSDLKLRLSAAANGNQEIDRYAQYSTYATGQNYLGAGGIVGGIGPNSIGNPDLKWETTYQYDAGLDVGLFEDRVMLTFDAYLKRTQDLLTNVALPLNSAFAEVTQNIGEVENKGIELGINSVNIANGDLNWNTQFNFSLNRNKVIDIGQIIGPDGNPVDRELINGYNITRKGQPIGAFYGWVTNGIFQNSAEIEDAAYQANAAPGDIRFSNLNADTIVNDQDRAVIGNPNPRFLANITNTITYKGFELSVFFQGSFGNDIYNQNLETLEGMHGAYNGTKNLLDRWTSEGQQTDVPRANVNDPNNNRRFSTRFIEDGSYIRMKNVMLAYSLPQSVIEKLGLSQFRLYVSGQNLLTFTDYSGYDPEVSADPTLSVGFGRDLGVYPQPKTYTVGVNVKF